MEQIEDGSYTPDPIEPHPIEREGTEGPEAIAPPAASDPLAVEPVELERVNDTGAPGVEPVDRVVDPLQWPQAAPLERVVEPLEFSTAPIERTSDPRGPEAIDVDRNASASQMPDVASVPYEHGVESPQPISWIERESQPLTAPQVTIDTPPESIDIRRLVFRAGPRTQETYFVS